MPEPTSPASAVLEALGFATFLRDADGTLRLSGRAPAWLRELWPGACETGATLAPGEVSPFLENFLIDAEHCWAEGGAQREPSGPWIERAATGAEMQLEATALTAAGQPVLLVERLGETFEMKKSTLQKARETVIAHQRLDAETQKKDILLHCLAEDLTASLGNIVTALRLLEMAPDSAQMRTLLDLASRATGEQRSLIHRVLDVFAPELDGLYAQAGETDVAEVARHAVESVEPQFREKGVALSHPAPAPGVPRVAATPGQIQRVVTNLLENALHHTPSRKRVTVRIEEEPDSVVIRVEDEGREIQADERERLFAKLEPDAARSQASVLRLHFCRIAVENCGGEIGCLPGESGGNCFQVRLPRIPSIA